MKRILGLDLGTNSIGWALVEEDFKNKRGAILGMGSRIIPMDQGEIGKFSEGSTISKTADRTNYRGIRRLRERHLLRRERLHRVLNVLEFLPKHYAAQIDFEKRLGKFKEGTEPKLTYDNKQFIFKESFEEMLAEFRKYQPQLLENGKKLPYDWTIYYLRKKALSQKINKEELAWILLNFNQKRGYYQLRGEEEEENTNKQIEFYSLRIVDVIADKETNKKGETWYSLNLENGWIYRRSSKAPLEDWKGKVRDFIVTTDLNDDGSIKVDKEGSEKRSFRAPNPEDWTLIKKKTEQEIDQSNETVGVYIYKTLLKNPSQKIRGKLVRTIERKYYKEELKSILKKQTELQPELFSEEIYNDCVRELYRNNDSHQAELSKRDFIHLFLNDIILYQRPLKSKKSSISNCSLEYRRFKIEDKNGLKVEVKEYLKTIPKSHPLYQEFRVWQWLYNLKIYKKEGDIDVTQQFIKTEEDIVLLFDFLMTKKEVDHKDILKYFFKDLKGNVQKTEIAKYRWNYVYDDRKDESKKYPCNETIYEIRRRLKKVKNLSLDLITTSIEHQLWHLIYSVTDKIEYENKALKTFANKHHLDVESFVENFKKFPPFKSDYGTFSEKAIKKLLSLLRLGKYWNWEVIDKDTKKRIYKIISGEYDEEIKNRVREKAINLKKEEDFQGLQLWLAQYIVYDRHSESNTAEKWGSINDLNKYLDKFKQHSLHNPIVEQVVTETLRVVKDIWAEYGDGSKEFFNEIHIELGRDLKNTKDRRKQLASVVSENEATNLRIKSLMVELRNNTDGKLNVEEVRPYSPMQQNALKIYEDGVLNSNIEIPDDIIKISKTAQPKKSELQRYKLWLEQKYCSPYTGQVIPLSKLFTEAYQIEHIIPQSRFFDDSFSNKVICEAAVNQKKDKQLGLEFIKNHHGEKIEIGFGQTVEIFSEEAYKIFVRDHYGKNRSKQNKLLLDEIPEKMIERQLNDTRYISKFVSNLLSNIVRSDTNDDGINSKNILALNGKITSTLKQDWGLNDVWNTLILPRFERMNDLTNSGAFTSWNENHQTFIPTIPLEYSRGFQRKRIDHRHHALDALIIACATRGHINLLNNQSAKSEKSRYDLQNTLRRKESYFNKKKNQQRDTFKEFLKPWDNFTKDAKDELEKIIVSFKQNLRIINKTTNKFESYKTENGQLRIGKDGKPKKGIITQTKGDSWAIRKPMHKEMVYGKINLPYIKVPKEKVLTAKRENLDISFTSSKIIAITDRSIQKILLKHLENFDEPKIKIESSNVSEKISKRKEFIKNNKLNEHPELAFSPEGIEDMNKNIIQYNNGKLHQPILKVRIFEVGSKFQVGYTGNKISKFVETAKGTNLFFAIYQDENGKREYETIPLNIVIERQKLGLCSVPETNEKENNLLFYLSPIDLVYVLTEEEKDYGTIIDYTNLSNEQRNNIYKMVSCTGSQCFFIKQDVATPIVNKMEFSALNKTERAIDGRMIKESCVKLKVDRLGNISLG